MGLANCEGISFEEARGSCAFRKTPIDIRWFLRQPSRWRQTTKDAVHA
jgi:hypothetical protein